MRRIRYLPGLISLALMLPLGLWYLKSQRAFRQERCFQMFVPPAPGVWPWWDSLNIGIDPAIADTAFFCSGNLVESVVPLEAFRSKISDLTSRNDTDTWLCVRFAPDTKYETVIHALETCMRNTDLWSLDGNVLLTRYYRRPPRDNVKPSSTLRDCLLCDDVVPVVRPVKPAKWIRKEVIGPILGAVIPVWPAIPLYIFLAILGIRRSLRDSGSSPE